jgi:hypothetical protein
MLQTFTYRASNCQLNERFHLSTVSTGSETSWGHQYTNIIILHFSILLHRCITCSLTSISNATQKRLQSRLHFKMPLKSHSTAICFGLPSSGNRSPTETAALHRSYVNASHAIAYVVCTKMRLFENEHSLFPPRYFHFGVSMFCIV